MGNTAIQYTNVRAINDTIKFKKDGSAKKDTSRNKPSGTKSEVFPFEIADLKKMLDYYIENEMWIHYLAFTLQCNTARRAGDVLELTWEHVFNPINGKYRADIKPFREQKTDKYSNPRINKACRDAIDLYISKTNCNPAENNYRNKIFIQLSGTHKGRVLSYSGYLKRLKKAANAVGIDYNTGTHSARKSFGLVSMMLHPGDAHNKELIREILHHSETQVTNRYIGLTKKRTDNYYDSFGDFYNDYVVEGKPYNIVVDSIILSIEYNDLQDVIQRCYGLGMQNAGNSDTSVHTAAIAEINKMIEKLKK